MPPSAEPVKPASSNPAGPRLSARTWRDALAAAASIELSPQQIDAAGDLAGRLPPGTEVYVPLLPNARWERTVTACRQLRDMGFEAVPHLTARDLRSHQDLDERLARLADAGVHALLLIAGDRQRPAGPFADTLAVLSSDQLAQHRIRRFGCAAHPEGHPAAGAAALKAALARKMEYAAANDMGFWLVTQFAFAPEPVLAWVRALAELDAPPSVRLGLPGPARLRTLVAFAARCGIGASARALTRRPGVVRLFGAWTPDRLLDGLAEGLGQTPGAPVSGIHVFAFGGFDKASRWLREAAAPERRTKGPSPRSRQVAAISPVAAQSPVADAEARHHPTPPQASDEDIANATPLAPIARLAQERFGDIAESLIPYGHFKAKLPHEALAELAERRRGKLVLVTAMSPTAAGEGKTTTTIGLVDALNRLGARASACLREPSLGPCFGMKGGATGGGHSQIAPQADINLHFTGDLHAVTAAHNLLAALLDNHLYWGNALGVDAASVTWRRALDLNDRALRRIESRSGRGRSRDTGFDITAASEVMAVLCLAQNHEDLQRRLGNIVVAQRKAGGAVTARDLGAEGALAALLRDALQPNIVQTLEGNPAFVHGGPFANIAHGCNSAVATQAALALSDIAVTEAGFGADLGAEKFLNIKCRQHGLWPDAVVLVCTARALKLHGGASLANLAQPNPEAVLAGAPNLARHIANLQGFGLRPVVAINRFSADSDAEIAAIEAIAAANGARAVAASHWRDGAAGAEALGQAVLAAVDAPAESKLLYPDAMPLRDKLETIATRIYGAAGIALDARAEEDLNAFEALGHGALPVCVAKTQYSFAADPKALGAPSDHLLPVREARLCAGAGFVVAICGDIMTMPGLPRQPAAHDVSVAPDGRIVGL